MIIGFSGLAGSGKTTAASFLVKNHGFVSMGLADEMKRMVQKVFAFSDDQVWGSSEHRNAPDLRYPREQFGSGIALYLTPRYALQKLGTEWGRDCYNDIWVDFTLRKAKQLLTEPTLRYNANSGVYQVLYPAEFDRGAKGVAISDVRFKNEMAAIKKAGGFLVRLKRGKGLSGEAGAHPSETEQLEVPDNYFDAVIDNRAFSLEELEREITELLKHIVC